MATNAYNTEQAIYYNPQGPPSRYFGFWISWSGDAQGVDPFDTPEQREAFVQEIGGPEGDAEQNYKRRTLAALVALETLGSEQQREMFAGVAAEMYPDDADAALERAFAWNEANL